MPAPIALVEVLRQSIDALHGQMNNIEAGAVAAERDTLTDTEQATWDELRAEAEAKTARLELLVQRGELDAQAGELVARIRGGATPADEGAASPAGRVADACPYRAPGDSVLGYTRSRHGDPGESARFTRALADVVTSGTPGLVPPQVTGDLLGAWLAARPSVDAMTKPTLPPVGMKVQRPRITQHTQVGPHNPEKSAISSQAFTVDLLDIPLESWAGGVDVSWELANRSSPGALDVVFQDLVRVYARGSNNGAFGDLTADVTQTSAWDGTAPDLATALSNAAITIAQNSAERVFPDTVWLGLTAYGLLASLTDTTGRPLFPDLGPVNAYGTADVTGRVSSVRGLRPVVDPNIPPSSFLLGNSEEVEFYETPGAPVQLSVVDVGVAGYNIGVIGMFACKAVDPKAFCKITNATLLPLTEEQGAAAEGGSTAKASK